MPGKSRAEKVAENRQQFHERFAEEPNSDEIQREILEPEGVEVELGGSPIRLYPLSGRKVRELMGLANLVFASAVGPGQPIQRIGGILQYKYADEFLPILAEATQPSDKIDAKQTAKVQAELDRKTQSPRGAIELSNAFFVVLAQNDVLQAFNPKAQPAEEAAEV